MSVVAAPLSCRNLSNPRSLWAAGAAWLFAISAGASAESIHGLGAHAGAAKIDEDAFLALEMSWEWSSELWHIGAGAPLRIRLWDQSPSQTSWIRTEDWDEISDDTRILRFLAYSNPSEGFRLRLGEWTPASTGHGTVVHGVYHGLDPNHYQSGLDVAWQCNPLGATLLVNNVADPEWGSARVTYVLHPRTQVAAHATADLRAPSELRRNPTGGLEVDSRQHFQAARDALVIAGVDGEWNVLREANAELALYGDGNAMDSGGQGLHLGATMAHHSEAGFSARARVEYHAVRPPYVPGYFDGFHEVDRWDRGRGITKQTAVHELESRVLQGGLIQLTVGIGDQFECTGEFSRTEAWQSVSDFQFSWRNKTQTFAAHMLSQAGPDSAPYLSRHSAAAAQWILRLGEHVLLDARYSRSWFASPRGYLPSNDFQVGFSILEDL